MNLLSIKNLTVRVGDKGPAIVDHVSFDVATNSITALVGGSGSGKSTTAFAIVKLLSPALTISEGEIVFEQKNLLKFTDAQMQQVRGKDIGFVFQEPLHAFDPLYPIGYQIGETLMNLSQSERSKKVIELLKHVRVEDAGRVANSYPHQLSGGLRQRAMIAQALAAGPKLLIADEPTSNLDVTIQAQIMALFRQLKNELGLSILLITHDLGVVEHLADQTIVLSQGKVVESGATSQMIQNPKAEYTQRLVNAFRI